MASCRRRWRGRRRRHGPAPGSSPDRGGRAAAAAAAPPRRPPRRPTRPWPPRRVRPAPRQRHLRASGLQLGQRLIQLDHDRAGDRHHVHARGHHQPSWPHDIVAIHNFVDQRTPERFLETVGAELLPAAEPRAESHLLAQPRTRTAAWASAQAPWAARRGRPGRGEGAGEEPRMQDLSTEPGQMTRSTPGHTPSLEGGAPQAQRAERCRVVVRIELTRSVSHDPEGLRRAGHR